MAFSSTGVRFVEDKIVQISRADIEVQQGRRYIYNALDYQDYAGSWTFLEAQIIAKNPIVDQMYPNDEMPTTEDRALPENPTDEDLLRIEPRQPQQPRQVSYQPDSPSHLRYVSLLRTEPIPGFDQHARATEYTYEPSLGEGTFIYHFDANFDLDHPVSTHSERLSSFIPFSDVLYLLTFTTQEFSNVNIERYRHPNAVDFPPNHGTNVAGMAVGDTLGVAKKATLVAAQISGHRLPEHFKDVWRWAINDIKNKGRTGKAVILWPRGMLLMPQAIATCFTFHHANLLRLGLL